MPTGQRRETLAMDKHDRTPRMFHPSARVLEQTLIISDQYSTGNRACQARGKGEIKNNLF
jgi:hypothetical protein